MTNRSENDHKFEFLLREIRPIQPSPLNLVSFTSSSRPTLTFVFAALITVLIVGLALTLRPKGQAVVPDQNEFRIEGAVTIFQWNAIAAKGDEALNTALSRAPTELPPINRPNSALRVLSKE